MLTYHSEESKLFFSWIFILFNRLITLLLGSFMGQIICLMKEVLLCLGKNPTVSFSLKVKSESVSYSVVSDSLWPQGLSPPDSSAHEILQARRLEWAAITFSRRSSWPRDRTQVSRVVDRFIALWAPREAPVSH